MLVNLNYKPHMGNLAPSELDFFAVNGGPVLHALIPSVVCVHLNSLVVFQVSSRKLIKRRKVTKIGASMAPPELPIEELEANYSYV
jgi:hypothetical protein